MTITVILGLAGAAQAADAASEPAPAGGSFVPGCVAALSAGSHTVTLDVDGTPREVIVHIPDVDVSVRLPAVVAFHGYSSFATDLEAVSGLSERADGGASWSPTRKPWATRPNGTSPATEGMTDETSR